MAVTGHLPKISLDHGSSRSQIVVQLGSCRFFEDETKLVEGAGRSASRSGTEDRPRAMRPSSARLIMKTGRDTILGRVKRPGMTVLGNPRSPPFSGRRANGVEPGDSER
jgi:hypothetical protein